MKIDLSKIKVGDILYEESHYVIDEIKEKNIIANHLESNSRVVLGDSYIKDLLSSSDQYTEVIKVTKEDKKDGNLGIRSIFENIKSSKVFTVVFKKQDKPKSRKALEKEINAKIEEFIQKIDKAKSQRKGVVDIAKKAFEEFINNPISDKIKGDDRLLQGYKIQFDSRDGKYNCVDINLKMKGESNFIRPVNINTIKSLIVDGIKYEVI